MTFEPKHKVLLNNDSMRIWYENVGSGSNIMADVYLRILGLFCKLNNTDSEENVAFFAFLSFKEFSYITGKSVIIDGGGTAVQFIEDLKI
ncbi:MAG: hypothetical protein ACP5F1_06290 [Thermoplasmata archaeon]|nr:hypothetical protein [Thermoplasmata archaeon]